MTFPVAGYPWTWSTTYEPEPSEFIRVTRDLVLPVARINRIEQVTEDDEVWIVYMDDRTMHSVAWESFTSEARRKFGI